MIGMYRKKHKRIAKKALLPEPLEIESIPAEEHHIEEGPYQTKPCAVCARAQYLHLFAEVPGCGHQFCQNCIVDWIQASFQKQMLHDSVTLTCPMSCGQLMTYQDLVSIITLPALKDQIESQYMRKYIHDSSDVVSCPNRHCLNAGIILKKPCNYQLSCESCGMQWKDPSQYTCWDKTKRVLSKRPSIRGSETWSNLSKVLFTVACPKCGVFIQKNGGCSHMVCSKCNHQFCWMCHGPHYDYQHAPKNNCGERSIKIFLMYAALFLLCFLRMAQWFPVILSWPLSIAYWISVVGAILFVGWFGTVLPIIGFFSLLKESCGNPKLFCPLICGTSIYLPLAYLFWHNFCYFQFGQDMWAIFTLGVSIVLLIMACVALGVCCKWVTFRCGKRR